MSLVLERHGIAQAVRVIRAVQKQFSEAGHRTEGFFLEAAADQLEEGLAELAKDFATLGPPNVLTRHRSAN